jgi:hypothetical protein
MARQHDKKALLELEINQLMDRPPSKEAMQKLKTLLLKTYDSSETTDNHQGD